MYNRRRTALITALMLLGIPAGAWANGVTALAGAGVMHLFVLNAFIGLGEGLLIAKLFKVGKGNAIGTMIGANYFSAFVTMISLGFVYDKIPSPTIFNVIWANVAWVLALFAITVILEWPFCYSLLREQKDAGRRSFRASLILQTASYVVLIGWYGMFSNLTLVTRFQPTKDLSFATGSQAVVYYISDTDKAIYKIKPDGTGRAKVSNVSIEDVNCRLYVKSHTPGYWDLCVGKTEMDTVLIKKVCRSTPQAENVDTFPRGNWCPLDIRPEDQRNWAFGRGYMGTTAIHMHNKTTGEHLSMGLETLASTLFVGSISILPGDLVVCDIRPDLGGMGEQILVLDLNKRKVGVLAMGECPVAVVPDRD